MFRKKKTFFIIFLDYIRNGRKKKTTKALLFQTGDPELPSAEEVDTDYDLDAEFLDPTVPIIQTEVTEEAAHIYESFDCVEENLFNQYSYDNSLSLHESLLRVIQNEDCDNHEIINNNQRKRRRINNIDEE